MNHPSRPNAFEVLRLDPSASNEEVVAQAARLRQRIANEQEWTAIRQAVQALTGPAAHRFLEQMLTHPDPCYHWPLLERFRAAFRRFPAGASRATGAIPGLDLAEVAGLLRPLLADLWDTPPLPLNPVDDTEPAGEIDRQNVEARWQCLIDNGFA
jgi:hypothetical protein